MDADASVAYEDEGRTAVVCWRDELSVRTAGALHRRLEALRARPELRRIVLDLADAGRLDTAGIATLAVAAPAFAEADVRLELRHLSEDHRRALEMMPAGATHAAEAAEPPGLLEAMGARGYSVMDEAFALVELLYDTIAAFLKIFRGERPEPGATTEQSVRVGVDAMPIIGLLSFLLGLIIAFQSAYQLRQFGANIYVVNLVGLSMVREFGPMMTAIILAGRSGAAIAAELGTMKVQEEIDALRTIGIDPIRFLVLPRLLALTLMQPALTLAATFIGIFGGLLIAMGFLDLSAAAFFEQLVSSLRMGDFWHGLLKSVAFAWIIGVTSCYTGMRTRGGASAVGGATTLSVVTSIFLIIVADSLFATITTLLKMYA